MKRHHHRPDALIEVLHTAQELFGHLDHDILFYVAHGLKLPPSRVYGVATFYHFFTFKPKGEHRCTVCLGTACYVKGEPTCCRPSSKRPGSTPGKTLAGRPALAGHGALPGRLRDRAGRRLRRQGLREARTGHGPWTR